MAIEAREQLERVELESLLTSGIFAKSPNLAKLLSYVCERYWAGETDQIKEYNLAVEALGRPENFDPSSSAIVRVEAHRLRGKLKSYYGDAGASHELMLLLEPGSYVPRFVRNTNEPGNGSESLVASVVADSTVDYPAAGVPGAVGLPATNGGRNGHAHPSLTGHTAHRFPARWVVIIAAAVIAILAGSAAYLRSRSRQPIARPAASAASIGGIGTPAAAAGPPLSSVRIVAGYTRKDYISRSGETWDHDEYFHGAGGVRVNPSQFIARTADPTLFATDRHGEFSYDIPLKPGKYELWLYFDETMYGPGLLLGGGETSRIFDVSVNGRVILSQFDVYADAGGDFIADERVFKDISPAPDGLLHIRFLRRTEEPIVDAIKVIPMVDGKLQPIRIVAQPDSYTDRSGAKWDPDRFYMNGRSVTRLMPVSGTTNPGLFNGERYGHFNYAIPVAAGRYAVTLYFSEGYFGPGKPGGGGVGSRVFNVSCNGNMLLDHFDVFQAAGGADRAVTRTFHDLTPNAQGKLVLRFDPVVNYALVDAIQVTDESK